MDLVRLWMVRSTGTGQVTARDAAGLSTLELSREACARLLELGEEVLRGFEAIDLDTERQQLRLGVPCRDAADGIFWQHADYAAHARALRELSRVAVRTLRPRTEEPIFVTPESRWEYLYQQGGDGWELGIAPPPLVRYLRGTSLFTAGARALVMGSGRGHEALVLAQFAQQASAHVVALDIAPTAVRIAQAAAAAAGLSAVLSVVERDLFAQEATGVLAPAQYDLIVEHCCFCAIVPERRDEYIAQVTRLLKPGGRLIALFYCHPYPGGPPFASSPTEIAGRLQAGFSLTYTETPSDSVLARAGFEWLLDAKKRNT